MQEEAERKIFNMPFGDFHAQQEQSMAVVLTGSDDLPKLNLTSPTNEENELARLRISSLTLTLLL